MGIDEREVQVKDTDNIFSKITAQSIFNHEKEWVIQAQKESTTGNIRKETPLDILQLKQ
jgi:hypothetical protein